MGLYDYHDFQKNQGAKELWNTLYAFGDFTIFFSRSFLDHFLRHGMPLMDKVFNEMRNDCMALLKNMQLCTRYLQHVCSFSRGKSDSVLAAHINDRFHDFFPGLFWTISYGMVCLWWTKYLMKWEMIVRLFWRTCSYAPDTFNMSAPFREENQMLPWLPIYPPWGNYWNSLCSEWRQCLLLTIAWKHFGWATWKIVI